MKNAASLTNICAYRNRTNILLNRLRTARDRVRIEKRNLEHSKDDLANAVSAQSLVQQVAETVQAVAHKQIASVVSRCLVAVFGETAYEFKIIFERKRGRTEAKLAFVRDGICFEDPLNEVGGGPIDVAAFALRLACLLLVRPKRRRLLIGDELFRHLKPAKVYGPKVVAMLETLADEFHMQFLMVQNLPQFRAGRIIEISQ